MENNKRPTQCDRVLRHLNDYGTISTLEAMMEYGIMRLGSRINELRRSGYRIETVMESGFNRYGEKTHWAKYKIAK